MKARLATSIISEPEERPEEERNEDGEPDRGDNIV